MPVSSLMVVVFAGAVGANKAENLALLDLHIQAIHGLHLTSGIGLGHIFKLDQVLPFLL